MYVFTSSQLVEDGSLVDPEVEGDCSPLELLDGDVVELVEAEVLGLLQPRSDRPQEVLGRHENLRQRERRRVQILSSLNCLFGPLGAMRLSLHICRLREEELCPGT